jgi:hypothetical protein
MWGGSHEEEVEEKILSIVVSRGFIYMFPNLNPTSLPSQPTPVVCIPSHDC